MDSKYKVNVVHEAAEIAGNTFEKLMCLADKYDQDREDFFNDWLETFQFTVMIVTLGGWDKYRAHEQERGK
jgi:hypothetical protein